MSQATAPRSLTDVRLLGVPVPLFREAAQHIRDLRRELAKAPHRLPDTAGFPTRLIRSLDEVEVGYRALLAEQAARVSAAAEDGEQEVDLLCRVPLTAREVALRVGVLLDEADAFCQSEDSLLRLATPPGPLALRRWMLGEVVTQIERGRATPWAVSTFARSLPRLEERAAPGGELAGMFAAVARILGAEATLGATLDKIVQLAVTTIDAADHAGVMLMENGRIRTPAATDDVPRLIDALQYETNEGPCLDAIREHEIFQTGNLALESRWPSFAPRTVAETGVSSMLGYRLFLEEYTMGALNLYARRRGAFDLEDRAIGSIFAAHAAVALAAAKQQHYLQQAVESRDVIGQAKGILMVNQHVGPDEAFDVLRRASQRMNVKLRDLAQQIVAGNSKAAKKVPPGP